jgi:uncharacterized protein YndB with AHSA1/START domain
MTRWFACLLLVGSAHADVIDSAPNGFTSEHVLTIAAPPTQVFKSLVEDVGRWWDPAHSYSGVAENFTIDPRPGGCFCEQLGDGGYVEHMRVVFIDPGKTLRLAGGLGPLQALGVAGAMTFSLKPAASGTELTYRYVVGGYGGGGLDELAGPVDTVQLGQLQRLKRFVETGRPDNEG